MNLSTTRAIALGIALGTTYVVGCSSQPATTPGGNPGDVVGSTHNPGPGDNTGSLGLFLSTGGITIDSATYTITGPGGFMKVGTFAVGDVISTVVDGLPAGTGYTVTITASAGDAATCSGSAQFDVMSGATTSVTVHLQCRVAPKKTGSVSVTGVLNICPTLDNLSAPPMEVPVGTTVNLVASASDDDMGPAPISYSWTATSGTIASPTAATTTFTCTAAGTATITVNVTDSDCGDMGSTTVICDAVSGADAGTADAGTGDDASEDTGVAETGAPDTGVAEAGAPDTGVAETGAPDTGVDTGTPPPACGPNGSTQACLTAQAPDCLACATTNGCLDPAQLGGTCEGTPGTASLLAGALPDGTTCSAIFPSTPTEAQVCLETLGTIFSSKCAATLQETPCLCGSADAAGCLAGTTTPIGPGYDTYSCDFGSTSSTTIQSVFTDQTKGAGQANALVQCAAAFGCNTCFGL